MPGIIPGIYGCDLNLTPLHCPCLRTYSYCLRHSINRYSCRHMRNTRYLAHALLVTDLQKSTTSHGPQPTAQSQPNIITRTSNTVVPRTPRTTFENGSVRTATYIPGSRNLTCMDTSVKHEARSRMYYVICILVVCWHVCPSKVP